MGNDCGTNLQRINFWCNNEASKAVAQEVRERDRVREKERRPVLMRSTTNEVRSTGVRAKTRAEERSTISDYFLDQPLLPYI